MSLMMMEKSATKAQGSRSVSSPLSVRDMQRAQELVAVDHDVADRVVADVAVTEQQAPVTNLTVNTAVAGNEAVTINTASGNVSPVVMVGGLPYDSIRIRAMGDELAAARRTGEMPITRAPSYNPEIIVHDHDYLVRLRELRGDPNIHPAPDAYNEAFVNVARVIQQRDAEYEEDVHDANVHGLVRNIVENQNIEARFYNLSNTLRRAIANPQGDGVEMTAVLNALRDVVQNMPAQGARVSQPVNMGAVMNELRTALQNMAAQGTHGVQAVNMEAVLEDVFETIETALLDAAGPLRLNVNRMDSIGNRLDSHDQALGQQVNNMNTQVGAMNNHISAVGNHVSALGTLAHSINANVTAQNGQMGQLGNQVNTLQNLINTVPALIQQVVAQVLPQALAEILPLLITAIMDGRITAKGANLNIPAATVETDASEKTVAAEDGKKKSGKGCFRRVFGRFFKKGGRKDDGDGMAC